MKTLLALGRLTKKPNWRQILASVIAAMLGVQSNKNRQRDFNNATIKQFLMAAFIVVIVFICSLYFLVQSAIYWLK